MDSINASTKAYKKPLVEVCSFDKFAIGINNLLDANVLLGLFFLLGSDIYVCLFNDLKLYANAITSNDVNTRSYSDLKVNITYFYRQDDGWITSDGKLFITSDMRTFITKEMYG